MDLQNICESSKIVSFLLENVWILVVVIVWSVVWKALALWRAAKNDSKVWFILLILVNTVGLFEILYILIFGKKSKQG